MALYTERIANALQEHLEVCSGLLRLSQREADALRSPAPFPVDTIQAERKALLVRLQSSALCVSSERELWQRSRTPVSETSSELAALVQRTLDTIMRALVLDRENEEALLRRGLLPARALPRAEQSQPHFVARTYQRHVPT
jgi:hypothetical protein